MLASAGIRILQRFQEPIAHALAYLFIRVIDRLRLEVYIALQEYICNYDACIICFFPEQPSVARRIAEYGRWLEMSAVFKQSDIDPIEPKKPDQLDHLIMLEQREREICTCKFVFHSNDSFRWCFLKRPPQPRQKNARPQRFSTGLER